MFLNNFKDFLEAYSKCTLQTLKLKYAYRSKYITVKNNLHNVIGFVLSTINFVAGTNYYGPKKDLEDTTEILYHLLYFSCTILQKNWIRLLQIEWKTQSWFKLQNFCTFLRPFFQFRPIFVYQLVYILYYDANSNS